MKPRHRKFVLASSFAAFAAACGWVGESSFSPASLVAAAAAFGSTLHSFLKLLGEAEHPEQEHRGLVTVANSKTEGDGESSLSQNSKGDVFREVDFATLIKKRTSLASLTALQKKKELSYYNGARVQWKAEVDSVYSANDKSVAVTIVPLQSERDSSTHGLLDRAAAIFENVKSDEFLPINKGDLVVVQGIVEIDDHDVSLKKCQLIRHEKKVHGNAHA